MAAPSLAAHSGAVRSSPASRETPSCVCGQLGSMKQENSICHTFQPTVVNHGSWRNVHVLHPTVLPASLRTHAAALSLGNPRFPKALACGQAALMATGIEWTTAPIAQAMESPNDRDSVIPCVLTTGQGASLSLTWSVDIETVMSVDGDGAFDLISRAAMMAAPRDALGCDAVLPFVLQFHGRPSKCIWEEEGGEAHDMPQHDGGEQSNPLMPAFLALGQHGALDVIQRKLRLDEKSSGIPARFFVVGTPARMATVHTHIETELLDHMPTQVLHTHEQHATFLERINAVPDLLFRAAAAANCLLRVWHPSWSESFAQPTIPPCGTASAAFTDNAIEGKPRRSAV